jgi:hypothetical protein
MGTVLRGVASFDSLALELTPPTRILSTTLSAVQAANDHFTGDSRERNAAVAGIAYGEMMTTAAHGFGREFAGRFGAFAGKLVEWMWLTQTGPNPYRGDGK